MIKEYKTASPSMFQIEFSVGEEGNVLLLVGQGRKNAASLLVAFESLLLSTMHQSRQNLKKKFHPPPKTQPSHSCIAVHVQQAMSCSRT